MFYPHCPGYAFSESRHENIRTGQGFPRPFFAYFNALWAPAQAATKLSTGSAMQSTGCQEGLDGFDEAVEWRARAKPR